MAMNCSHLQGMLNQTVRFLEAGIKSVFVFDGEPPDMKKKEPEKRSLKRDGASKDLNRAIEDGDEYSIEKFSKRTVKVITLQFGQVKQSKVCVVTLGKIILMVSLIKILPMACMLFKYLHTFTF